MAAALLRESDRSEPAARPPPVGKELRATLAGKAAAMSPLAPRVAQRDGPHIQPRVALTAGAEALQQQVLPHFPQYTLVLDLIHATEYLWDTANALLGETLHSAWRGYVRTWSRCWRDNRRRYHGIGGRGARPRVHGAATASGAADGGLLPTEPPVHALRRVPGEGWPMGTGVVEGRVGTW